MYSTRAESGEKLPKGAKSSDRTGEKKIGASMVDKEVFRSGASGEKVPRVLCLAIPQVSVRCRLLAVLAWVRWTELALVTLPTWVVLTDVLVNSMTVLKSVKYIPTSELGTFKINKS